MVEYQDCPYCEIGVLFIDEYSLEAECDNCGRTVDSSELDNSFDLENYPDWDRDLYDERFGNE